MEELDEILSLLKPLVEDLINRNFQLIEETGRSGPILSRKKLCACLWKLQKDLDSGDKDFLEHCFGLYLATKSLYPVVQRYRSVLKKSRLRWISELVERAIKA